MADKDFQNDHSEELNRHEHRRKNVSAKASLVHGYKPDLDSYFPVNISTGNDGLYSLRTSSGRLVTEEYDYIERTLTNSTTETYVYKSGGSGGTTAATVTVVYTDSTLGTISTVTKT